MDADYKSISEFVKNNTIKNTYTYRETGDPISLDILVKRKELKRRSICLI